MRKKKTTKRLVISDSFHKKHAAHTGTTTVNTTNGT